MRFVWNLIQLTKPRIMLLVLVSGAAGLTVEGSLTSDPVRFGLFLIGLYLTGGCANALNEYFEREIDARMSRTSGRRPLPLQHVRPGTALAFSLLIGTAGVALLALAFNLLTAGLAMAVILFYSLVYTLWLKPTTSQNIVIGGVAGAMAPVGAWAAATGELAVMPWLMFLVIFLWTPPHFWALALRYQDDYDRAGLPMLPNVKGRALTLDRIFQYSLALVAASLLPLLVDFGWLYLVTSVVLGGLFLQKAWLARRTGNPERIWAVFKFSIVYLFCVFIALMMNKSV